MFFTRVEQTDQFQLRLTSAGAPIARVHHAHALRRSGVLDLGGLLAHRDRPSLAGVHTVALDLSSAEAPAVHQALQAGADDLRLEVLWEDESLLGTYLLHAAAPVADPAAVDAELDAPDDARVALTVRELGFED